MQVINRQQRVLRPLEVEQLIPEDPPARALWELVGQGDLGRFYAEIKAVEGVAGREPGDPQLLISLWIYADSETISSAREIERRCVQLHPGFGWLTGLSVTNHHTLSDFRTAHRAALEQLLVEVLGVLSQAGVVSLERVMHDGTKIKANAADNRFGREPSLRQPLEAAEEQVKRLEREAEQDPDGKARSRRQRQAQVRAARERPQRIEPSLAELEQIRAAKKEDPQERAEARASLTDPEARIMKHAQGAIGPAYHVQISSDAAQRIMVGMGVSQSATDAAEWAPALERIEANLGQKLQPMGVDGGFTHQTTVEAMAHSELERMGSLTDRTAQTEANLRKRGVAPEFFPGAFTYDAGQNHDLCPEGKVLRFEAREKKTGGGLRYRYRAAVADGHGCRLARARLSRQPQGPLAGAP